MATRDQLTQWLSEAEAAQHRLMMGEQEVQVRDSNGDQVMFSAANASRLAAYIKWLRSELAALTATPINGPLRPVWS